MNPIRNQRTDPFTWQRSLGFSVFPVKGKVPLVPWKSYQSAFPTALECADWGTWPGVGMAIVCGTLSRLAVLDVDPRHNGDVWMKKYPALAPTVWTGRGDGGRHTYFRVNESVPTIHSLLPSVDLQGEGAYVVAPPSLHPDTGWPYRWAGTMLREVPEWVRERIATPGLVPLPSLLASGSALPASAINPDVAHALDTWLTAAKPGDSTVTRCPCHADHSPSLLIRICADGNPWVKCFGGCHPSAIEAALASLHPLGA